MSNLRTILTELVNEIIISGESGLLYTESEVKKAKQKIRELMLGEEEIAVILRDNADQRIKADSIYERSLKIAHAIHSAMVEKMEGKDEPAK